MTVAKGKEVYTLGKVPCAGVGLSWTDKELDSAINGPVVKLISDKRGQANVASLLVGLAETKFEEKSIARILESPENFESWRVGEAIAQTYLTDHRDCDFPWPNAWDQRKNGSSLPGADLVGFCAKPTGDRFAFGEVKTSRDAKYPPGKMHGRAGLKQQIEDLRDQVPIRDQLVRYLGHRANGARWKSRYQAASKRYLENDADVNVFGVLVRDVAPHRDDLRVRIDKLASKCPNRMNIELLSLYLPAGSIDQLERKTSVAKQRDNA